VPNVKGKTLREARVAITKRHCRVGKVTRKYSNEIKRNHVISQRPAPGTVRPSVGRVALVVSRGRKK
jgi:beta-lactam-binding protein with PASTA domain